MIRIKSIDKKQKFPSRYTENAVCILLATFGRVCAIYPIFTEKRDSKFQWWKIFPLIVLTTILVLCCWAEINKVAEPTIYSSKCVFFFEVVILALLTLFSVSTIINTNFIKKKKITKLYSNLRELDYLMGSDSKLLQRRQRVIVIQLITVHIFVFIACGYDIFSSIVQFKKTSFVLKIPDYINEYIMSISVLIISNYALSINYKFTALNASFAAFVKCFLEKVSKNELQSVELPPPVLTTYLDAHNKLCNIIDSFNECYGLQIFGILFIGVVNTTYTVFLLLVYASGKVKLKSDVNVIYILLIYINFCLIFTIFSIVVTIFCTMASREARRTSTICYKLLLNVPITSKCLYNRALRKELLLFAEQVSQRKINFTVGGFLTIDYNTLYNLLGSTAMNVIILLQFQKQGTASN